MMAPKLDVWRDCYDGFELVGEIRPEADGMCFAYALEYSGPAISVNLPVDARISSAAATRAFFAALVPEGPIRQDFLRALKADGEDYVRLLESLGDESIGALVFSSAGQPNARPAYQPIGADLLREFSQSPRRVAFETLGHVRLSLSGAMAKLGLYQSSDGSWYLPEGTASSTHIVKAGSASFPHETVNEAFCLNVARRCGFDVPEFELLAIDGNQPLLSIRRYDRPIPDTPAIVDGLPIPRRLHQEDLCQACGLPSSAKYEPTDGGYLSLGASKVSSSCSNAFGETQLFVDYVLFDYLMGNCDNHLKNYALLYAESWDDRALAPMYDVVSTAVYPQVFLEMGVSFGGSRAIVDVTREAMEQAVSRAGVSARIAMREFDDLVVMLPGAMEGARDELVSFGFPEASAVFDAIYDGAMRRGKFEFGRSDIQALQ